MWYVYNITFNNLFIYSYTYITRWAR
jgi:hypothetical protein